MQRSTNVLPVPLLNTIVYSLSKMKRRMLYNAANQYMMRNKIHIPFNIIVFFLVIQTLMNVKVSFQCVTVMLIVLTLMVAMSVRAGKDMLAMEHSALVILSCKIALQYFCDICAYYIGKFGNLWGMYAADIDECLELSPCNMNANCTNTVGSFNCECIAGYTGDGLNCSSMFCISLSCLNKLSSRVFIGTSAFVLCKHVYNLLLIYHTFWFIQM